MAIRDTCPSNDGKKLACWSMTASGSTYKMTATTTNIWFAGRLLTPEDRLQFRGKYFPYGEDRYNPSPANYGAGFALVASTAAAILVKESALTPAIRMFIWNGKHYAAPNRVWFGWFHIDSSVWASSHPLLVAITIALAILPCVLFFGVTSVWAYTAAKHKLAMPMPVQLCLLTGIAMILAAYPRVASNQLMFAVLFSWPFAVGKSLIRDGHGCQGQHRFCS